MDVLFLEVAKGAVVAVMGGLVGGGVAHVLDRHRAKLEGGWWEAKERWALKAEVYPILVAFYRQIPSALMRTWNAYNSPASRADAFRQALEGLRTSEYRIANARSAVLLSERARVDLRLQGPP
jgi:hypothetical protein